MCEETCVVNKKRNCDMSNGDLMCIAHLAVI